MAPKRAMKADAKPAKKVKVDPNTKNIGKVVEALQNKEYKHDAIDIGVRDMLANCGAVALETVSEQRHPFQVRMVEMVEEALSGIRANLKKTLDEQNNFAANADNVKAQHERDLADSQAAKDAKQTEIAEKTEKKNSLSDAFGQAVSVAFEAEQAALKADGAKETTTAAKAAAAEVYQECFIPLKDTPDIAGAAKLLQRLEKEMEGMEVVDESLQKAAPNALVKAVKDRGQFDTIALDSLNKIFLKFDKDSAYTIENADSLAAAAHKKSEDMAAAQEAAETAKNAAQEALAAAKQQLTEINKAIKDHEKALKGHDKRVAEIDKDKLEAEAALECFDLYVLDPFKESKTRQAEKEEEPAEPMEEEPAEPAEGAEAAEPAAEAAAEPAGEQVGAVDPEI